MGRLTEQRKAELTKSLPAAETTKKTARAYMAAANLGIEQFARLLGYSLSAVEKFTHGDYSRAGTTDLFIREAIEGFMAKHPVGVARTESEGRLYETANVREIRQWFTHCQHKQALAFVYGPPGSQKTFALQHVVAEFNRRELARTSSSNRAYMVRASINISPRDLIRKICAEVGAPATGGIQRSMDAIRFALRGTRTVIVIDEAQLCGIPALEAVRELNDKPLSLGILLAGSHGLKTFFDQNAHKLEQWNSRMDMGAELSGVSDEDARNIIKAERSDLKQGQITALIAGSRVRDIYSRERDRTYISMRRLFKNLAALNALEAEEKGIAA
ncbi:MAG TPA: ATP-binding protein [Acidobacteriaceae bacterium]|jgi:DNA transposition AAA+ family ATPase